MITDMEIKTEAEIALIKYKNNQNTDKESMEAIDEIMKNKNYMNVFYVAFAIEKGYLPKIHIED